MSPSAFHRCQHCGYETDLSNVLGVFEEDPHCRQCGLSASESDMKMQDELANMMERHLHFGKPIETVAQNSSMPTTPQVVPQQGPIAYISSHYHHSSHQVPVSASSRIDVPVSTILVNAGVDPTALTPSQLELFKNAPQDQQLRLIELWRIAPPTHGSQMIARDQGHWPQSSMQQEEDAAAHRWEGMEHERFQSLGVLQEQKTSAEPYIVNGYDSSEPPNHMTERSNEVSDHGNINEYRPSTDPVHQSREWWRMSASQPMEHQYGMLQHMQMYGQQLDQSGEHDVEMF